MPRREPLNQRVGDALKQALTQEHKDPPATCELCPVMLAIAASAQIKRKAALAIAAIGEGDGDRFVRLMAQMFYAGRLYEQERENRAPRAQCRPRH